MKPLFFKTKDGELINLAEFQCIYPEEDGYTILQRSIMDSVRLAQPISDIENFLLKIQGAI
jgi:hypothetical protein